MKPGKLPFKSVRSTILASFALVILCALATFLMFSLSYTENTVLENSSDYTGQLVEQVNADIDSYIHYMENISQMVTQNSDVKEFLFGTEGNTEEKYKRILELFQTILDTRNDIYNIAVLCGDKIAMNRGEDSLNPYVKLEELQWYQNTMEGGGASIISPSHVQNVVANEYHWVVTLSKALRNPLTDKREGLFFIDLNYSAINDLCAKVSLGSRGYVFIVDASGKIIYHPKQQLLNSGLQTERIGEVMEKEKGSFITDEGSNSKLYTISKSVKTGWTVVGVSYTKELMKNQNEYQLSYIYSALLLFAIAMFIAILLSRAITKPIEALKESMKEVEKGNFQQAVIESKGENEIASLGNAFNIMTNRIENLMEENILEQKEKRKNELKALQSQINPHFLYNTLDSIIWMAESGKNQEVVVMTSSLAKLLRQSISNEAEIVTIEQEIGYTRSYLTIQKMRYRDQLEFCIEVDEEVMSSYIVKLVIQPLVENAIYHGIKYLETEGMVTIRGHREHDNIVLSVQDNGVGMSREVMSGILKNKQPNKKSSKVGVYNVHNRLQLYYGKEYGLRYESAPNEGCTVYITIPASKLEVRR